MELLTCELLLILITILNLINYLYALFNIVKIIYCIITSSYYDLLITSVFYTIQNVIFRISYNLYIELLLHRHTLYMRLGNIRIPKYCIGF